ncbi:MAG: N-acetyl-gamma-glutamyl-phosphate reductase [Calditrichaceae bacterium]|nr:N-acetyl-gamma-glutamyl-phosphate reductase [Calditrichaceae bacterium]MBN2709543.1 N-acetyl-gamma-glutamyl-phosphate reductase [Calditrichaceae bacterium]RQV96804.1 MAG: N-acetyl-gamma-glutamyl-phosphate reductase [Calditrichota bacterium]
MSKIQVSIAGGSGYTGGELLRLLLFHPHVEICQVTSERLDGKPVHKAHPNLRKQTDLKFCSLSELKECDLLFLCLPHGKAMQQINEFKKKAERIIDLSADFRLNDTALYEKYYGKKHVIPELLNDFVYGIPELHREEMRSAKYISSAGCNATTTILGLYPLYKHKVIYADQTVVEVKVGSSEGGNAFNASSHHPERAGCVRSFMPAGHRHVAEMLQELNFGEPVKIHFSATSIDMIRGVLATSHVFLKNKMEDKDIWKIYRTEYGNEPFIRIVKERDGIYRYPEPKLLMASNYCDVGFEIDPHSNRLIVISAIDNLMKGAAGQALQAFNIMSGFDEKTGLEFPGLHPV